MDRRRWLVVGLAVGIIGVAVGWLLWPSEQPAAPPRERQYRAFTACLLTDDKGLAGDLAKATWAGMQHASVSYSIKVQYLAVTGPQTAANASAYFNSLALQECQMVIAAGDAPVGALMAGKGQFSGIVYIAVGGAPGALGVVTVPATPLDAVRTQVDALVSASGKDAP